MKEPPFSLSPDDPRLTAYAFGELDPSERAMIDTAVRNDPNLQAVVNEIRALGGELEAALATEPLPSSPAAVGPIPMPAFARPGRNGNSERDTVKRSKILRFPSLYYVMAGAAAAAFAVIVVTRDPVSPLRPQAPSERVEIAFTPAPSEDENKSEDSKPVAIDAAPTITEHRAAANVEAYTYFRDEFLRTMEKPRSTFAIDIGKSSYADVRRFLNDFRLPPTEAVRIEELVNYFPYQYEPPPMAPKNQGGIAPLAAHLEVASAPWAPNHRLIRIGLKGRELSAGERGEVRGTSITIAKDVSLQIEFNPAQVAQYRLIGYENPFLKNEDLKGDIHDAVDIVAGQSVTAFYEIIPLDMDSPAETSGTTPPLKYSWTETDVQRLRPELLKELLTLTLRYKEPAGDVSKALEFPLLDQGTDFESASPDFQFAAAVASFGMLLRESPHRGIASLTDVSRWAQRGSARDPGGYRSEFLGLVRQAGTIRR